MALLDEIADAVGVSPRTVLNVLNGRNKENWPSTARRAEQIRAAAQPVAVAAKMLSLAIPRDLSLVSFGNAVFFASVTGRHLSSWQWPEREVGRAAIELLLSKIAEPSRQFAPRVIAFTPCGNESVGPAPTAFVGEKR